jgi:hypothetical protein
MGEDWLWAELPSRLEVSVLERRQGEEELLERRWELME